MSQPIGTMGLSKEKFKKLSSQIDQVNVKCSDNPGISFTHLQCVESDLWIAALVLKIFLQRLEQTFLSDGATKRHKLVYVLPDMTSHGVFREYCSEEHDADLGLAMDDKRLLVVTYTGMAEVLQDPEFIKAATIVIDTNFGRYSPQLISIMAELTRLCLDFELDEFEELSCSVVIISPTTETFWDAYDHRLSEIMVGATPWQTRIAPSYDKTDIVLHHVNKPTSGERLETTLVKLLAASYKEHQKEHPDEGVLLASLNPLGDCLSLAAKLRPRLTDPSIKDLLGVCRVLVMAGNTADGVKAVRQQIRTMAASESVILLVDSTLRFLPGLRENPIKGWVLPDEYWTPAWCHHAAHVVSRARWVCRNDFRLARGMGQSKSVSDITVHISVHPDKESVHSSSSWTRNVIEPAWGEFISETVLGLIRVANRKQDFPYLEGIAISTCPNKRRTDEILRRMSVFGIVKRTAGEERNSELLDKISLTERGVKVAEALALRNPSSVTEALHIPDGLALTSRNYKMAFAVTSAVIHTGIPHIIQPLCSGDSDNPKLMLNGLQSFASGFYNKGRLWAAVGAFQMASQAVKERRPLTGQQSLFWQVDNGSFLMSSPKLDEIEQRFIRIAGEVGISGEAHLSDIPATLTDDELFSLEVDLVAVWINNLVSLPASESEGGCIGVVSAERITPLTDNLPWGNGLDITKSRFAIHFGLTQAGPTEYTTDTLTLVSARSVRHALARLFSYMGNIDDRWKDILARLRPGYAQTQANTRNRKRYPRASPPFPSFRNNRPSTATDGETSAQGAHGKSLIPAYEWTKRADTSSDICFPEKVETAGRPNYSTDTANPIPKEA
ncbi:hypothetical protein QBC44DRAFT_401101 [Cladorrhinum sp. PSN332]|nr:hypothetical protein QBC44DRAFT_401101 [Cladorrhinum sp. PSN332]